MKKTISKEKVVYKPRIIISLLIAVVIIVGLVLVFSYNKKYQSNQQSIQSQEVANNDTAKLIEEVGRLIILPQDETPIIATITDKNQIENQPFFNNAENGDKLLAYTKSMKAILYRPSIGKIVEVQPIVFNNNQASSTERVASIKVAYYNGTSIKGLATEIEKKVIEKFTNATTVIIANAAKSDYRQTLVIDLSGKMNEAAKALAELVGGVVSTLPADEKAPEADLLIITGNNLSE